MSEEKLKIYNSLTKQKQGFKPLRNKDVSLYTCGPTVYWFAHIGNFSTFVREDFVKRYLEYKGYKINHIMNITDVGHLTDDDANTESGEDKMLKAARKEKKSPIEIAEFYTEAFMKDSQKLNIEPAAKYPKATEEISGIIKLVEDLIQKDFAYEVNDNVFFDILKFKDYGKLSGKTPDKITTGMRLEPHPDKKNPGDFALWLKAPENHIMQWDSPWGRGYPGWHIECSEMAMKYLGETIDIHIGGEDHLFPHHENEIAQSESATGKPFANFWMHMKFILINNEKMSKSKNNIYTLSDLEKKGFAPEIYRLWLFSGHYRNQANFSWEVLEDARNKLNKLIELKERLKKIETTTGNSFDLAKFELAFSSAMDDDFNTPKALDTIFALAKELNSLAGDNKLSKKSAAAALELLAKFDKVLGVLDYKPQSKISETEIEKLVSKRNQARNNKDFTEADRIRSELLVKNVEIEDTPEGTTWKIK